MHMKQQYLINMITFIHKILNSYLLNSFHKISIQTVTYTSDVQILIMDYFYFVNT